MSFLTKSSLGSFVPACCVVLLAASTVTAGEALSITAHNDKPGAVQLRVAAKDAAGVNLQTPTITIWDANNNAYSTQVVNIPSGTRILKFTFLNDCCGPCGAACSGHSCDAVGDPDCDRNAAIDSFTVFGVTYQGEDFDRTNAVGSRCGATTIGGVDAVVCGVSGQFAEYDLADPAIPTVSTWGLAILALLLLAGARTYFGRRSLEHAS